LNCKITNIVYIFDAISLDSEPLLSGLPFYAVQGKDFDKVLSLKNMQAFFIVLHSLVVFCDQSV
jgi:hypothetical protein